MLDQCISAAGPPLAEQHLFTCNSMERKGQGATKEDFNYKFGTAEIMLWDSYGHLF